MYRSPWTVTVGPGPSSGSEPLRKPSCAATVETENIASAHIESRGANVIDTFYLTDEVGAPLTGVRSAEVLSVLEQVLTG